MFVGAELAILQIFHMAEEMNIPIFDKSVFFCGVQKHSYWDWF